MVNCLWLVLAHPQSTIGSNSEPFTLLLLLALRFHRHFPNQRWWASPCHFYYDFRTFLKHSEPLQNQAFLPSGPEEYHSTSISTKKVDRKEIISPWSLHFLCPDVGYLRLRWFPFCYWIQSNNNKIKAGIKVRGERSTFLQNVTYLDQSGISKMHTLWVRWHDCFIKLYSWFQDTFEQDALIKFSHLGNIIHHICITG